MCRNGTSARRRGGQIGNGDDPNSDWAQGYGYQIWQCRHGAFRADGMYGQFCVVHPATDTILVTNCITQDMGGVLNAYYDEVLMKYESDAVADEPEVTEQLRQKTANLRYERDLPEDDGSPIPPEYLNLDAPNVWMRLTLDGDMLTMRNTQGQLLVIAGRGRWHTIHRAVHCEPFFMRDKADTPALGAWGMKDGRLTPENLRAGDGGGRHADGGKDGTGRPCADENHHDRRRKRVLRPDNFVTIR